MSVNSCVCGSGRPRGDCHAHIHPDSLAAKLCRYQALTFSPAPACRNPDRYGCFLISETEFVMILDDMRGWPPDRRGEIMERSKEYRRRLEAEVPEIAQKINGRVSLWELFLLSRTLLPFHCVFHEDGDCAVHSVRPLACGGLDVSPEFLFFKYQDGVIFRRPLPLFYWFALFSEDDNFFDRLAEAPFYRDLLGLSEHDYIERLAEYDGRPP